MRTLLFSVILALALPVAAQKKLVPVTSSTMTGMALPAESKNDLRALSVMAGKMFLADAGKKTGSTISATEILLLADQKKTGFTLDSFVNNLNVAGWTVYPHDNEKDHYWLQKSGQYILGYFKPNNGSLDIYFGTADNQPAISTAALGNMGQPNNTPVVTETSTPPATEQNTTPPVAEQVPPPPPPPPVNEAPKEVVNQPEFVQSGSGGFHFTSTNFDNGWVSTIEEDKVVATKGPVKVYIYFPIEYDDNARQQGRDYYWDQKLPAAFRLISKFYRDGDQPAYTLKAPYIEGEAMELKTGQRCYIALFTGSEKGNMYPTLAVAPDVNTLRSYFPKGEDSYNSDLGAMRNYNKFAIAPGDLTGNWVGGASAALNYYSAYTGNYMGMNAAVTSDEFTFSGNGTYTSEHKGATGMVGSMNTFQQHYKGSAKVSDWQIILDHRWDNKTEVYDAYFEAIRGGRILRMKCNQSRSYDLVKK